MRSEGGGREVGELYLEQSEGVHPLGHGGKRRGTVQLHVLLPPGGRGLGGVQVCGLGDDIAVLRADRQITACTKQADRVF